MNNKKDIVNDFFSQRITKKTQVQIGSFKPISVTFLNNSTQSLVLALAEGSNYSGYPLYPQQTLVFNGNENEIYTGKITAVCETANSTQTENIVIITKRYK